MAVQTITYDDKSYLNQNSNIADVNKVNDTDMNEIKTVVNNNANELITLQAVELFNGSTTGTVTLNDSSANYSYLEIFYEATGNYNSVKIPSPNGKYVFLTTAWIANNTVGNIKIAKINISGSTISKINYTAFEYGSSNPAFEENSIEIVKVIGYK